MEKIVDGIRMEIPDDATRETLLRQWHRPADSTVYAITADGGHRVLNPGESAAAAPGERLGIIGRFRTGRMVAIEGIELESPDDATRETLLEKLEKIEQDRRYTVSIPGKKMGRVVEIGKIRTELTEGSNWDAVLQRVSAHTPYIGEYHLVLHSRVRQRGRSYHASKPIDSAEDGAFSLSGCAYE